MLEPLDDVIPESEAAALRSNNDAYVQDGTRYGLLWNATPYALFWNKKLTDAAGVQR